MSFHSYTMPSITGETVDFHDFKGTTCLVVNVASACGLTPQYNGLVELHAKHQGKGFAVLGFPCNQFGGQEPGSEAQICEFVQDRFNVDFPMFGKVEVNGAEACDLYKWLTTTQPTKDGTNDIRWNFTKFLIDGDGQIVKRFEPQFPPERIDEELEELLG